MRVDAVFFDAGATLLYADPPVGHVYAKALRRAGIEADPAEVQRRFNRTWRRLRSERAGEGLEYGGTERAARRWWRRVVRECFREYAALDDFDRTFQSLWEHFARGEAWSVYDDAKPTLCALRERGKGLGLISNWDARLERVLEEKGLSERLDWTVISHQVGSEKPDGAVFRRALNLCGLPPPRVAHVGDSYEEDVVGARRAGLHALWLRREADEETTPCPVPTIRRLTELMKLID